MGGGSEAKILETTKPTPHSPLACLDPSPELVPQVKARSETVNAIERWIKMSQCPLRTLRWQLTNSNCQVKQQPTLGCLLALGVRTTLHFSRVAARFRREHRTYFQFPRHPLGCRVPYQNFFYKSRRAFGAAVRLLHARGDPISKGLVCMLQGRSGRVKSSTLLYMISLSNPVVLTRGVVLVLVRSNQAS